MGAGRPAADARGDAYVLPGADPPLELAISKLGYDPNNESYLLDNINRWRGQLALDAVEKVDEAAGVRIIELEGGKAWLLDATGQMAGGGMMGMRAPFAGGGQSPPINPPRNPAAELPTKPANKGSAKLVFETPDSWNEVDPGSVNLHQFELGANETAATLKLSKFPLFGQMGEPLANFNRWRGQVGLSELTKETLGENTQQIDISDTEGVMAIMKSPDGSQAMLAAMVTKFNQVWFFKLTGSAEAIDAHAEEVTDWLGRVEISAEAEGAE